MVGGTMVGFINNALLFQQVGRFFYPEYGAIADLTKLGGH